MGKKTKKTRWRTLSIGAGEGGSDSETPETKPPKYEKYGRMNGWSNHQKYSNQSSPVRQQPSTTNGSHHQRGYYTRSSHPSTTRSSSTGSEQKMKFNEDEYTRITTPRQDVLFKKGYLSKPKPYLQQQRSLTSTGNSTGDGTPDHQSADGNDVVDGDYDPFMFPSNFMDSNNVGMFFVNGFEPYAVPPHHVLVYDQYGNAVVCMPPPQLQPPPTAATLFDRRSKRYSTDSMTESTSPHNESNQDATSTFNDTDEGGFVNPTCSTSVEHDASSSKSVRKKRRRKKLDKEEELSSDELSSLSGQEDEEDKCDTDETSSCKYRVDAEEFVPRSYRQQVEFVQLPVGLPLYAGPTFVPTMFPHQIYFNNPHHFTATTSTTELETSATETTTTTTTNCDTTMSDSNSISNNSGAIDIAKIVSKLEEAAKETISTTTTTTIEEDCIDPPIIKNEFINIKETNKTESVPLTTITQQQQQQPTSTSTSTSTSTCGDNIRYSERLKLHNHQVKAQHHQQQHQQQQQQQLNKIINKPKKTTNQSCPRLERLERTKPKPNKIVPQTMQTTTASTTNQWIAVSGKKKRGKNKLLTDETEPEPVHEPEAEPDPEPQIEIEQQIIIKEEEEVPEVVILKQERIKNNPKKQSMKKRILINDDLIVGNPQQMVVPETKPEPPEILKSSKKKSKKPKNKKPNEYNNNEPTTTNIIETIEQQTDDVSLELDRMIQRGLYGNLEERLRSFNPADSFIVDVLKIQKAPSASATAAVSVIGTMAAAVLKKPSTYFGATMNAGTNGFIPPKVVVTQTQTKDQSDPPEPESTDLNNQRFPITRAVREWMNKTRENTPEVEIFKKPNEIREEFKIEEQQQQQVENGVEMMDKIQDEQQVDDMSPQLEDIDLLDCWEPEINYDQQQQQINQRNNYRSRSRSISVDQVEEGEDALMENYESVYGRSDDFARIQREVQQQKNNSSGGGVGVNVNNVGAGAGALPYRAICCSIM